MHAAFERWEKEGETYKAVPLPDQDIEMPFTEPLSVAQDLAEGPGRQ